MTSPKVYIFSNPSLGELTLDQVVDTISSFLASDPDCFYRLVIGSDSHTRRNGTDILTNFITAIVIHKAGKGGRYFWSNGLKAKTYSLRDKIYRETQLSLDLAAVLVPKLNRKLKGLPNWDLEIHIDVGQSGPTRTMIREVVGMVVGSGYKAKTKPESFAASSVADRYT